MTGSSVWASTHTAETSRASAAETMVAVRHEERVRIARDLHDVVAHHITLVNAQAGVVHHLMRTNPEQAYEALAHIKDNSQRRTPTGPWPLGARDRAQLVVIAYERAVRESLRGSVVA